MYCTISSSSRSVIDSKSANVSFWCGGERERGSRMKTCLAFSRRVRAHALCFVFFHSLKFQLWANRFLTREKRKNLFSLRLLCAQSRISRRHLLCCNVSVAQLRTQWSGSTRSDNQNSPSSKNFSQDFIHLLINVHVYTES